MADVNPVTGYARAVIDGKEIAGELVRLACERHIRDLAESPGNGLRFDPAEADRAFRFWSLCPHIKGKTANKPIKLEPWQRFIVGSVYGWKLVRTGKRRYRVIWIELPRKNGKTTLIYPAGLYGMTLDREHGAEVYAVATKKDQARIVYELARRAVVRSPEFSSVIRCYAHNMVVEETFSKFEALGADADTLDGLSPSVVLADEIHKWKGRALWDVIETGIGAREQPLIWAITTAGTQSEADIYGAERVYGEQVLRGLIHDETRFVYIASLDPGDDINDQACWKKANPNLGVTIDPEELAQQVQRATASPAAMAALKRFRFGLRQQDSDAWILLQIWDTLRLDIPDEALSGKRCFGGLDLANTSDFAAFCLCFPLMADLRDPEDGERPDMVYFRWRLWIPREGGSYSQAKLREIVAPWAAAGWVTLTDGDCIDHEMIEADILRDAGFYKVERIAYDPFNAASTATRLQREGLEMLKFPQSMSIFAEPTKRFEELILSRRLRHPGNPCVRWMADNCVLTTNAAGHRMPSRKRSKNKIDGIVAAVESLSCLMVGESEQGSGFYDRNGLEVI